MDQATKGSDAEAVVQRLADATNAHDLEALVGCFASDYRNETPVHPARGFVGREQVRRNWEQIFGAIADVRAELVSVSVDGDTVWSEWEHAGTRPDGTPHLLRGIAIFVVQDNAIASARFYLEPVDDDGSGIDRVVERQVAGADSE